MNFSIIMISPENSSVFKSYIGQEVFAKLFNPGHFGAGLLLGSNTAAGALAANLDGDVLWINWIYTDEKIRRRGGGRLLINAAKSLALSLKSNTIRLCSYGDPPKELSDFLRRLGFGEAERGNIIYSANLKAVANLPILKTPVNETRSIKSFSFLTQPEKASFRKLLKGNAEFASGVFSEKIYEAASVFYVERGAVTAFCIVTEFTDDDLYLYALYADKAYSRALPALIGKSLRAAAESGRDGRLILSAANESSKKLTDKLLKNAPVEFGTEISWIFSAAVNHIINTTEEEITLNFDEMKPELDILAPKLMSIELFLEEAGISCSLIVGENQPFLEISEPEEAQLFCRCISPETLNEFIYTAIFHFPSDKNPMELQQMCDSFNSASSLTFAAIAYDGIFLRANLPEQDMPVSGEQFLFFWKIFCRDIKLLNSFTDGERV
jgi:hypothetical protein